MSTLKVGGCANLSVADPGFPRGGGANSLGGGGRQHTILPTSHKNCMKLKEFGPPGGHASLVPPLDPPLPITLKLFCRKLHENERM